MGTRIDVIYLVQNMIELIKEDPLIDDHTKWYIDENLEGYLHELIDKYGSLSNGIICALEDSLDK